MTRSGSALLFLGVTMASGLGCSSEGASGDAAGACKFPANTMFHLCVEYSFPGADGPKTLQSRRDYCSHEKGEWVDACDPTLALGACQYPAGSSTTPGLTREYFYRTGYFRTAADVKKHCAESKSSFIEVQ